MRSGARAPVFASILIAAAVASVAPAGAQQQSVSGIAALDTGAARVFERRYSVFAEVRDSLTRLGERVVSMTEATYAGAPAWLVVETRSGLIPAIESLFVSRSFQPLQYSSVVGTTRLVLTFPRDSVFGGTTGPAGRQTIVLPLPPPNVVSVAMLEAMLAIAPLGSNFGDSVTVLAIDAASARHLRAELAVIGEDSTQFIVALRTTGLSTVLWVDRQERRIIRARFPLALHGADALEYHALAPNQLTSPDPPNEP